MLRRPSKLFRTALNVLIAAACVMASVVVTQPANAETGYSVPIRSGHSWASGIYSTNATGQAEAVGTWRGAPIDTMQFWPARAKWSDFVTPVYGALTGKNYIKVLGIPMIPEGGSTLLACAAGSYNKYWTQFATSLRTNGIQNSTIVRLGWEFNGDWYVWKATNQTAFATCWRHIVKTVRAVTPNVKFDWNVIRGSSPGAPGDTIMQTYPGNDVVDIVGVDSYDWWRTWEQQLNDKWGLNFWLQFAKDHGKKLSVPEWGLMPSSRHGNNDNPGYIQHMFNFFKKNASYIAYEQYFNSHSNCACQIYPSATYPKSSALYASLW